MFEGSVPYLIIVVLFFRGITLDGAEKGIKFYLSEPDFSHVFKLEVCFLFFSSNYLPLILKTWRAAATHVCYTLAIGFGGLLSLSSFNRHNHNSYRDAVIITVADGLNSLLSGVTVFAGFLNLI